MFSQKNRLTSAEVRETFNLKKRGVSSPLFYLLKTKNNLNFYRFAVIIGKKIYKKSTDRNKAKRKIVSVIKKIENIKPADYILTLKKDILKVENEKINSDLVEILN